MLAVQQAFVCLEGGKMELLFVIVLFLGATLVPVMVGARLVHAQNTSLGSAFFAIIALAVASATIGHLVSNPFLAFGVSVLVGAVLLSAILGTTFVRGLAIGAIIVALQFAFLIGFMGVAFVTG
jgi:hypothetical protein